jgi:hypothetical protein
MEVSKYLSASMRQIALFDFMEILWRQLQARLTLIVIEIFFMICLSRLGNGLHCKIDFYYMFNAMLKVFVDVFFQPGKQEKIGTQKTKSFNLRVES